MRVRVRGAEKDAQRHLPAARLVVGMLLEQLRGAKVGRLNRRLQDGTLIEAWMDGTLPIVQITPGPNPGGPCVSPPIDMFGVACTVSEPDLYPLPDDPALAYQPCALMGFKTERPAPARAYDLTRIRSFWCSGKDLPEGEPIPVLPEDLDPVRYYDRPLDACGQPTKLHPFLLMGNWDWHNADQTHALSCKASGQQRYGVKGIGTRVYYRGRVLVELSGLRTGDSEYSDGYVLGMAFRDVEDPPHTVLMVIIGDDVQSAVFEIPVQFRKDDEYPTIPVTLDGDYDPLFRISAAQMPGADRDMMWAWNASGTEARRIRGGREEQITLEGFADLGPADQGGWTTTGTSLRRISYYPLSMGYNGDDPDNYGALSFRYAENFGRDGWPGQRADLGNYTTLSGSGTGRLKLAVDFIGDAPEYLWQITEGGSESISRTAVPTYTQLHTSSGDNLVQRDLVTAAAALSSARTHRTPTLTLASTTYGTICESWMQISTQVSASAQYDKEEHYELFTDGVTITGELQWGRHNGTRSADINTVTEGDTTALLYADLRHGLFITRRQQSSGTLQRTESGNLYHYREGGTHLGDSPIRIWDPNTESVTETAVTAAGDFTVTVWLRGAPFREFITQTEETTVTGTSTTTPVAYVNIDQNTNYNDNFLRFRYQCEDWVYAMLGAEFGSPFYWPNFGAGDYWDSPDAVSASTPATPVTIGSIEGVGLSWAWPTIDTPSWRVRYGADINSYFGAVVDVDGAEEEHGGLFLSMPLQTRGPAEPWALVNLFPFDVVEQTSLPLETTRFYPMTLVTPAFISIPPE